MAEKFASLLRRYRELQFPRRADFAKRIDVSLSYVSLMENEDDAKARAPKRHVVNEIADALKLSFEQRNELLRAADHEPVAKPSEKEGELQKMFQQLELAERERDLLVRELIAFAKRWKAHRDARKEKVTKAVIPCAGWQSHLLSAGHLKKMVVQAVNEAVEGGINNIVLVAARSTPELESIDPKPTIVIQSEPLGLGHAVLLTRDQVGDGPFALILPVDVDERKKTISEMKTCYEHERVQKPILAVNPANVANLAYIQHYGVAEIGDCVTKEAGEPFDRLRFVEGLQEKRADQVITASLSRGKGGGTASRESRMIVGRYILTPDIFDYLLAIASDKEKWNRGTKRVELTDALETFRMQRHFVYAYTLSKPLTSLASVRVDMERMIDSLDQPGRHKTAIDASRRASASSR